MMQAEFIHATNLEKLRLAHSALQSIHPDEALNMDEVLSMVCQLDVWLMDLTKLCQPHVDAVELLEQNPGTLAVYKVKPQLDIDPQKLIEVDLERYPGFGVLDEDEDEDEDEEVEWDEEDDAADLEGDRLSDAVDE